jgi:hypothetical protein
LFLYKGRIAIGEKQMKKMLTIPGHKKLQIKTILRAYLTSVRMTTIRRTNNSKCW